MGISDKYQGRSTSLFCLQKFQRASWIGTNLYMNRPLTSPKYCSSYFLPVMTSTNSLRSEEALIASLAPLRTIQLCFSSKAESYALQRISDMLALRSLMPQKVTLMKVSSHINLSRFLPVESQCLYSFGALRSLLLPPLYWTMLSCISMLMKLKKPACPLNLSLFSVMTLTLSLTSEKAMPRKVLISLKALQN